MQRTLRGMRSRGAFQLGFADSRLCSRTAVELGIAKYRAIEDRSPCIRGAWPMLAALLDWIALAAWLVALRWSSALALGSVVALAVRAYGIA